MYRQYLSRKNSPSRSSTARSKDIAPRRSYGSLSSVLQRAQKDPKGISDDEWKQLDSAIGSRVTGEVLGGDAPGTILEKGISARLWGDSVQEGEPIQAKGIAENEMREEQNPNNTGLPDKLKAGVERLSGLSMEDVRVHYNSSKPAQLQALAYTQGTSIYVGPGQEKHLPHEAWHVVQQKEGRVRKREKKKERERVYVDWGLEEEATRKGEEARREGREVVRGNNTKESGVKRREKKDEKKTNKGLRNKKNGEGEIQLFTAWMTNMEQILKSLHEESDLKTRQYYRLCLVEDQGEFIEVMGKPQLIDCLKNEVSKRKKNNFKPHLYDIAHEIATHITSEEREKEMKSNDYEKIIKRYNEIHEEKTEYNEIHNSLISKLKNSTKRQIRTKRTEAIKLMENRKRIINPLKWRKEVNVAQLAVNYWLQQKMLESPNKQMSPLEVIEKAKYLNELIGKKYDEKEEQKKLQELDIFHELGIIPYRRCGN